MKEVPRMIPNTQGSLQQIAADFYDTVKEGKVVNAVIMIEFEDGEPMIMQAGEKDDVRVLGFIDWMKESWRYSQLYVKNPS